MIDVDVLRAAGLTEAQIATMLELAAPLIAELKELREYRVSRREQNRKDKQKQRSRQADIKPRQADRQADIQKLNGINGHVSLTNGESSSFFFLESERKKEFPPNLKPDYEEFYAAYPRKVGKVEAEKAYAKARKRATHAEIMAGLKRQVPDLTATDPKYRPHPATWLNHGRWLDEVVSSRRLSNVI